MLGAASALAFGAVDVGYAFSGRISPVYVVDAALEAGFGAAWLGRSDETHQPLE